ncbi:Multicopper oxidase [Mycena venus]|uniref:Multicopper oxidase n=1 Tax=Mycena venus TaxID=2733690 RepID=A0A8H7CDM5_9AGAR|nr:Multicopper oxidase [Mycena venus]
MPDPWPDTAPHDDEQALLMAGPDSPQDARQDRWTTRKPPRRKRASALSLLTALFLPFVFLLWMTFWTPPDHPGSESHESDAFPLNPKFDKSASPKTRIYRWTVSVVPVPGANRKITVVNGRSPGPMIEANVHDRILVYVTNGLQNEGTYVFWMSIFSLLLHSCKIYPRSIHWFASHHFPSCVTYRSTGTASRSPIRHGTTAPQACHSVPSHRVQPFFIILHLGDGRGQLGGTGTAMQHTDGLFGPLIVHSPTEGHGQDYAAEHVLTLSDVLMTPANDLLKVYMVAHSMETTPEPVPDSVSINGRGGGPHADNAHHARASHILTAARRQETHGVEDNPGYPSPSGAPLDEKGYFEVKAKVWTTTRLRLIHAGTFAPLRVSIDGHALTIIEADGSAVEPVRVRDLVLQPAQRYSVLITRNKGEGNRIDEFWIRAKMVEDKFAYENPNLLPEARAILRYPSTSLPPSLSKPLPKTEPGPSSSSAMNAADWWQLPQFDEWVLRSPSSSSDSNNPALPSTNVLTIPWIFSIQRTHDLNWRSFVNGTSWEIPPMGEATLVKDTAGIYRGEGGPGVNVWPGDQLIATLEYNQTIDFVITNLDDGDHPFHLHGYAPWLLGTGRGRYKATNAHLNTVNPLRRDTFTVSSRSWAVVRIVADNPGYWAFHCHIAWHMMGGGFFQIAVPSAVAERATPRPELPDDIVEQCKMWNL